MVRVRVVRCGPAANESEVKALKRIESALRSGGGEGEWVLLANLAFSVSRELQSDEVDLIAIGPPGVRVLEVKHWLPQWVGENERCVYQEAERVTAKARRVATTLRKRVPQLPHVHGAILLTQEPSKLSALAGRQVRGIRLYTLNQWAEAIGLEDKAVLEPDQIRHLARLLEPTSGVAIDGSLRRLAGYVNLELQTPPEEQFHRVYRGTHPTRQDRVILHLYDLSATDEKNAEAKARREFEALHRVQRYPWAPRILDSFQPVPGYVGEMFFFTVVDPAAPSLEERAKDGEWPITERLNFARASLQALAELHGAGTAREPLVHRNLTPKTILVKHNNMPVFTGFQHARIPACASVASGAATAGSWDSAVAPEVRTQGLGAADCRSDVYSLCSSLLLLFQGEEDTQSRLAREILAQGMAENPAERSSLERLGNEISRLLGEPSQQPPPPPAPFWTEDQIIPFRGRKYRIVARLGSGGVGAALKVVELDQAAGEELGSYVAKVVYDKDRGERILRAYNLVRSHSARHPGLSTIFEVAPQWEENQFAALLSWVEGTPLAAYVGVFPLLAEDFQESSPEALARRWLQEACQALSALHDAGLVHGDVSPRNMIVSGANLVLTDYDFVTKVGETLPAPGTLLYCSPSYAERRAAAPSDDIYALAASFFHILFDREPFRHGSALAKERGLNWEEIDSAAYASLLDFFKRATDPDPARRFASAADALAALAEPSGLHPPDAMAPVLGTATPATTPALPPEDQAAPPRTAPPAPRRVPWLLYLLQSFPGSRWGNSETRGLDSQFSADTYVPTPLEAALEKDIRKRRARLVVLCGNAGDGKTALLQHLASRLGLGQHKSADRIIGGKVPGGPEVRINLDGSAAWKDKSADQILDEFLEPFQNGRPDADIVHLLAINDGRLLEWIESVENRRGPTVLTKALYELLQEQQRTEHSYVRFISLNRRSLVGGIERGSGKIDTDFLDRLLEQLYGGQRAAQVWSPCAACSAKGHCEVFRAARVFGPAGVPEPAPASIRDRARRRLFEALQAVHLRGKTHITVRELRAALVYILFGLHYCEDYHDRPEETPLPYWDRAFDPETPSRQGELLRELAFLDPALEAHPQIDRYLVSKPAADSTQTAPHYADLPLASARRRAYFEWTEQDLQDIAGQSDALGVARGWHLKLFRELPLADQAGRAEICKQLCKGIARLEHLPPQALDRENVVPLRIAPRTPTETSFWVEKPLEAFRLEADLPPEAEGLDRLHRQAYLIYRYRNGQEERLALGAELFSLLLELAEGYQLGDVASDDTFAHLSIFVQRLVREDDQQLLAWNPMQDEVIYRVSVIPPGQHAGAKQRIVLSPI